VIKFDLAERVKQLRRSRRPIVLPKIATTQAQASNLASIYRKVIAAWQSGLDRINAAYAKSLNELQMDSADDIRSALDAVQAEVQRLILMLTPELREWAFQVERIHRGQWAQSVLSASDVDLNTILTAGDVEETLASVIEWNVALVRDVDAELQRRIANAVFVGLQQRKAAVDVAKEIREAVPISRARSIRIASDQTVKLGARLNRARREQAGIGQYKWRHSGKAHPRSWHLARNGIIYKNQDPRIPPDDRAGIPPFCGCTEQAVITLDDQ
jgi:SPP1 gp7 family putative phage head morphogenesis protein